jgi:phenylalanyl-tRNA synthetase alpha chain
MQNKLNSLKKEFLKSLENIKNKEDLKELEADFLGKKGKLKDILKGIKDLTIEEKKTI